MTVAGPHARVLKTERHGFAAVTNHANPPSIIRNSSAKRNFTRDTAHFIEERVFSKNTGEGKNFHLG